MTWHTHPNDPDNVWPDDGSEDIAILEGRLADAERKLEEIEKLCNFPKPMKGADLAKHILAIVRGKK